MKNALLSVLAFTLFLQGCASAPRFKELTAVPENKAVLYIYREGKMLGAANSWEVFVNGKKTVKMSNGGYYVHTLEPGPVVVSNKLGYGPLGLLDTAIARALTPDDKGAINFEAEPKGVYYVELVMAFAGLRMEMRDYDTAIKTLKDCKLLEASTK